MEAAQHCLPVIPCQRHNVGAIARRVARERRGLGHLSKSYRRDWSVDMRWNMWLLEEKPQAVADNVFTQD